MALLEKLLVKIGVDLNEFERKISTMSTRLDAVGQKMSAMGRKMTAAVTLPILGAATAAIKFASDTEEALNKVDVSFGQSAQSIKDFAQTTLDAFGIARGTALDMAAGFGDMATSMGLTNQKAAEMSMNLVGLAGDLASFKNISIDIANTALIAIFTGETESLKKLGIVMTQANLDAFAMANGFDGTTKSMTESEKVLLRYAFVMEKTGNAQGDFAATSDSTANSLRIMTESLKEAAAALGEVLLPVITPIIKKISDFVKKIAAMDERQRKIIVTIALLVAAVGPLLMILGALASSFNALILAAPAIAAAFTAVGTVISAMTGFVAAAAVSIAALLAPISAIILAITALVAILVLAIKYWKDLKSFADAGMGAVAAASRGGKFGGISPIPQFATGTNFVPSTGLALVHKGERIIPANVNAQERGGASGGGAMINIYPQNLNDAQVDYLFNKFNAKLGVSG